MGFREKSDVNSLEVIPSERCIERKYKTPMYLLSSFITGILYRIDDGFQSITVLQAAFFERHNMFCLKSTQQRPELHKSSSFQAVAV